jgi:hypothetical protein
MKTVPGVDRHRQAELARSRPHLGQPGIIGQQELAEIVPDVQAEVLPDLHALRAGRGAPPEALAQPFGESRRGRLGPVEVTEGREAPGVRAIVAVEVRLELVAPSPVEVHDRAHAAGIYHGEELVEVRPR